MKLMQKDQLIIIMELTALFSLAAGLGIIEELSVEKVHVGKSVECQYAC